MVLSLESCSLEETCAALGTNTTLLFELRDELRNWLKLQPHLPQDVPDHMLEHTIFGVKMSLELAKQKLDMFYSLRQHLPEFFSDRDPRKPSFAELHKMIQIVHLPKLTPEKYTVCIFRPIAGNYRKFRATDSIKYAYMLADILMFETRALGYIVIMDMSKATLGYAAAYSATIIRKTEIVAVEAYALRVKCLNVVNGLGLANQVVSIAKSVLKPKLSRRLQVDQSGNYELLHKIVPKSILPKDYGGDEISIDELSDKWRQKVDDYRDWFREQDKISIDERLRPGPALDPDNLFGTAGSFRKLDVD